MINLKDRTIEQRGRPEPILRFEVWWRGPFGLYSNLEGIIDRCKIDDFDPQLCCKPVCVAISDNMMEEMT